MFVSVLAGVLAISQFIVNPSFVSPNGEMVLVVRDYPRLGDFERVDPDVHFQRDVVEEWLDEYPLPAATKEDAQPEPVRGALYRLWPGGRQELVSAFAFRLHESRDRILVADDGHFVTYGPVACDANAELLTIRRPDGSLVRTLLMRDVMTGNDRQWLCRGKWDDVRWSIRDDKLHAKILVTDTAWDDREARHETLEIDLATGAVPSPDRNLCPSAVIVAADLHHGIVRGKAVFGDVAAFEAADVVPISSAALLERAAVRVIPEYPEVAHKARVAGSVRVEVVVGRDGAVETARIEPLPFGIDQAVMNALPKWKFEPNATRYSGSFLFRFEIIRAPRIETTH